MKKTTASVEQAVVIILQSVRRTRSRRRDFCVQMGFGVCTNKHPLAKWIARGLACYNCVGSRKLTASELCRCPNLSYNEDVLRERGLA